MEKRDAALDNTVDTHGQADTKLGVPGGLETQKRVVKLTAKALADKIETLQSDRKAKLNRASVKRKSIQCFISQGDKTQVLNVLEELIEVCDEAKCMHTLLLGMLPCDEGEKHETWFKAKMMFNDECIADAELWVSSYEGNVYEKVEDGVNPDESVSNMGSKHSSQRSNRSGKSSTTSSVRIQVEAKRAALIARAAALKESHVLEEQEQQLRRRRQQHDLDTEIAASAAMLTVLQASDLKGSSRTPSDGMASYFDQEKRKREFVNSLNPMAKEYKPEAESKKQDDMTQWNIPLLQDVRPKQTQQRFETTSKQRYNTYSINPQIRTNPTEDILAIMHRQNEITASLVQQQRSSSLPPRDIRRGPSTVQKLC